MSVTYKPIDWLDGLPPDRYRVGDDGGVWRWYVGSRTQAEKFPPRWKRLLTRKNGTVLLSGLGRKTFSVAVGALVCRAFQGPCPLGFVPVRIGSDPKSNAARDLRWGPKGFPNLGKVTKSCFGSGRDPVTNTKLTESDVIEIRRRVASGELLVDLADIFGVRPDCIKQAATGGTWSKLPGAVPTRGRQTRCGEDNPDHRLTSDDVRRMRRMARRGIAASRIACRFGVKHSTAMNAICGTTWGHVGGAFPGYKRVAARGTKNGSAKLTESDVIEIRRRFRDGSTCVAIASEYGMSNVTINCIVRRKIWKHVPDEATITTQPKESRDGREA